MVFFTDDLAPPAPSAPPTTENKHDSRSYPIHHSLYADQFSDLSRYRARWGVGEIKPEMVEPRTREPAPRIVSGGANQMSTLHLGSCSHVHFDRHQDLLARCGTIGVGDVRPEVVEPRTRELPVAAPEPRVRGRRDPMDIRSICEVPDPMRIATICGSEDTVVGEMGTEVETEMETETGKKITVVEMRERILETATAETATGTALETAMGTVTEVAFEAATETARKTATGPSLAQGDPVLTDPRDTLGTLLRTLPGTQQYQQQREETYSNAASPLHAPRHQRLDGISSVGCLSVPGSSKKYKQFHWVPQYVKAPTGSQYVPTSTFPPELNASKETPKATPTVPQYVPPPVVPQGIDTYKDTPKDTPKAAPQDAPNHPPEWTLHHPPSIHRLLEHSASVHNPSYGPYPPIYMYDIVESYPDSATHSKRQTWGPLYDRHTANVEAAKLFVHRFWTEVMQEKRKIMAYTEEGLLNLEIVTKVGGKGGERMYGRVFVRREERRAEEQRMEDVMPVADGGS